MFAEECIERLSEMYEDFKCDDCKCFHNCNSSVICRSNDCLFIRANEYMYNDYAYEEDVYDVEDCYSAYVSDYDELEYIYDDDEYYFVTYEDEVIK